MKLDPGLAYYERPIRNTAWMVMIAGVLVAVMLFSGLPEYDRLGDYLCGRERVTGIMLSPGLLILLSAAVAGLVYRMGTGRLRAVARVLATAAPRRVAIAVRYGLWPGDEIEDVRWYVEFGEGREAAGLPASLRIAPPPGSAYAFRDLQEEAQVYAAGEADDIVIRTSRGLLLTARRRDAAYP